MNTCNCSNRRIVITFRSFHGAVSEIKVAICKDFQAKINYFHRATVNEITKTYKIAILIYEVNMITEKTMSISISISITIAILLWLSLIFSIIRWEIRYSEKEISPFINQCQKAKFHFLCIWLTGNNWKEKRRKDQGLKMSKGIRKITIPGDDWRRITKNKSWIYVLKSDEFCIKQYEFLER